MQRLVGQFNACGTRGCGSRLVKPGAERRSQRQMGYRDWHCARGHPSFSAYEAHGMTRQAVFSRRSSAVCGPELATLRILGHAQIGRACSRVPPRGAFAMAEAEGADGVAGHRLGL